MIRRAFIALLFIPPLLWVAAMSIDELYLPIFQRDYFVIEFDSRLWRAQSGRPHDPRQPDCPRRLMVADLIEGIRWGRLPRERWALRGLLGAPEGYAFEGLHCDRYRLCYPDKPAWLDVCFDDADRATRIPPYRVGY